MSNNNVLRGINASGGSDLDQYWSFPTKSALDYYHSKGFEWVRVVFRWERLQPKIKDARVVFDLMNECWPGLPRTTVGGLAG